MRPHTNNSFSYKTIDKRIRNILEERSKLDNTTQVSMPFIKATTTLQLPEILGNGIGFTLGIHATELDIKYQDIYASQNGSYLAGYTYQPDGTNKLIYADPPTGIGNVLKIFDLGADIYDTTDFSFVPPPGITKTTIGKRRDGLISVANISFSVPTLVQLEFLHRTFLVPGIGMVLEWGQQFAPKKTEFSSGLGETGLIEDFSQYMFPWYGENAYGETKEELFQRLARNQISTQEILEKYSYPTQGQYQWMFGRVASFNVNSNSDGSYECMIRITGPAEDSWAYSVRNTSVPAMSRRGDIKVCIDDTNSVESYFTKESGIDSFVGVLEATINGQTPGLTDWQDFVKPFPKPEDNGEQTTSEDPAEDLEDAYFISWRYFVNVILNDETYGVKSIFKNANELPEWLDKISLLRPYNNINGSVTDTTNFEDPYENFVGTNLFLRSTDLSTMIVVNEKAAEEAEQDPQRRLSSGNEAEFLTKDSMTERILELGDFYTSAQNINNPPKSSGTLYDRAFLSTGVWINHKAIIQAFSKSPTILDGIQTLLTRMSSATNGFWNLAIDVSEPAYDREPSEDDEGGDGEESFGTINGIDVYNYTVVDLNYAEHSEYAVQQFLGPNSKNRVHVFNKFIRNQDGVLVGSELTDCKIDISLPKSMFSQIATLGLVQPQDKDFGESEEIDGEEVEPATISDINDQLREMFSITSIARRPDGTSADLTALTISIPPLGTCSGQTGTQDEAGTIGGGGIADTSISELSSESDIEERRREKQEELNELDEFLGVCEENCRREEPAEEQEAPVQLISDLPDRLLTQLTIGEIKQRQANRHMFAVGKYQAIPSTLKEALDFLELNDSTVFSPEVQERIGDYIFTRKRRTLGRYLEGQPVSLFEAQLQLAQEFASMPVPVGTVRLNNRSTVNVTANRSISYYAGDSAGNTSKATAGEVAGILERTRASGDLSILKNFVSNFESARDTYNAANVIPIRGGRFYSLFVGTANYRRAMNDLPFVNATSFSDATNAPPVTRRPDFRISDTCPLLDSGRDPRTITVANCNKALRDKEQLRRTLEQLSTRERELPRENSLKNIKRKFPHLASLYRYFEPFTDYMVANIRKTSDGSSSNSFGAAPGALSIKAQLEMPGINGLRLGELFWIDRMPSFYRAYGAFIILGVEEDITPSGWVTKFDGTFYYLGNVWKRQMAKILSGEIES